MSSFVMRNKVVNAGSPVDINAAGLDGDYVSLKNWEKCVIIIQGGVVGAASTITVNKATTVAAAGATAMTFDYWRDTDVSSSDALTQGTATAALSTGTNNGQNTVIEIRAEDLGDYDCISLQMSDPGVSSFWSAVYVLQGGRYQNDVPPSAIID